MLIPNANSVQDLLGALGNQYGFNTTSIYRTPDFNTSIGGATGSQHTIGTARDYSVKGKTWTQIQDFLSNLKANGFNAFYESASDPHSTGPHVHAQLAKGGDETNCPSWVPDSLCKGYKAVTTYGKLVTPGGVVTEGIENADTVASTWLNWQTRTALFVIAVLLIGAGIFIMFKEPAIKLAGDVAKTAVLA